MKFRDGIDVGLRIPMKKKCGIDVVMWDLGFRIYSWD